MGSGSPRMTTWMGRGATLFTSNLPLFLRPEIALKFSQKSARIFCTLSTEAKHPYNLCTTYTSCKSELMIVMETFGKNVGRVHNVSKMFLMWSLCRLSSSPIVALAASVSHTTAAVEIINLRASPFTLGRGVVQLAALVYQLH